MRTTLAPLALAFALAAAFTPTPTFAQLAPPRSPGAAASTEVCTGGVDEDGDGQTDCDDSACASDSACAGGSSSGSGSSAPAASPAPAKPTKQQFAERWHAQYDPATSTITCTVPVGNPYGGGKACWSPGYDQGKAWDWDAAPYRWAKSWGTAGEYVSKGTFQVIDRTNAIQAMRGRLDTLEVELNEKLAGKADKVALDSALEDLAEARAALDAAATNFATALGPVQSQIDDVTGQVTRLTGRVTALEGRVTALEASDAKQNRAIAHLLRNAVPYFDGYAGLAFLAGKPVLTTLPVLDEDGNETEETEDWFHRHDRTSQFAVGGTVGLADGETGHGLQLSGTFSWGADTGGTGLNFSLLGGPMFRLGADGVVGGVRGGLNVSQSGIRDGVNLSSATGAAFTASFLLTPPMPFLPQLRLDMGAVVERVRYDDLDGTHRRPTVGRFLFQVTGGFGGTIKKAPVSASDFDEDAAPMPAAAPPTPAPAI